jgi:hypothetical protein
MLTTTGMCRESLKRHQALGAFVQHAEVEPTNHAAEGALRPDVLWCKGSLGPRSAEGSHLCQSDDGNAYTQSHYPPRASRSLT